MFSVCISTYIVHDNNYVCVWAKCSICMYIVVTVPRQDNMKAACMCEHCPVGALQLIKFVD